MRKLEWRNDYVYDFGDEPNEVAKAFMKEHFGFDSIDHLTDDECEKIQDEINDKVEYGEFMSPFTEHARMMIGVAILIDRRWGHHNPDESEYLD